jgi:hypothetical protein
MFSVKYRSIIILPPFMVNKRQQVDKVHLKGPFPLPILAL